MLTIDKLCYTSALRYVNAAEKFFLAVCTLFICVFARSLLLSVFVLALMSYLTVVRGGIPAGRYLKLLRIPMVFLLLGTLTIIVNLSHTPLDAFAFPVGSWYITGSVNGLLMAARLIVTALAAVSCLYFLSLSTPMTDILQVLSALHCPDILVELMMLIYRFIFVLLDISHAISTSQDARLGNKDFATSLESFGLLGSALFVRAYKKSGALYDAMESRCYQGTVHVLSEDRPAKTLHIVAIVLFEVCLTAAAIVLK